jgi:electron transport complex protein RnfG
MNKYTKMILSLSLISLLSGILLGGLDQMTKETIENNILKFKKIPAVAHVYQFVNGTLPESQVPGLEEQLLTEKRYIETEPGKKMLFFVIRRENQPYAVAIEDSGKGFGGDLGVMSGFNLQTGELVGIGITTLSETPGLGARVQEEAFGRQFAKLGPNPVIKVKKDGGDVDAVTGATISSRAVCQAIVNATEVFNEHREQITAAAGQ